eukprot:gene6575-8419_t
MRSFLAGALADCGIRVYGDAPALGFEGRGAEIRAWLAANPD